MCWCPLNPGNLSAYGLLTVDVRNDYVQTAVSRASVLDLASVQEMYDELAGRADAALAREGFAAEDRLFVRTADLRYFGQAYEVRVDVPAGPVDEALVERGRRGVPRRAPGALRLRQPARRPAGGRVGEPAGHRRRPDPQAGRCRRSRTAAVPQAARTGTRAVWFDDWVEAGVYDRARLGAGDVVEGPAVLEEFSSTVPLHPGFAATVDRHGNLVIRRSA